MEMARSKPKLVIDNDYGNKARHGVAKEPRVWVPDAIYEAQVIDFKERPFRNNDPRIYVNLEIITCGEHFGKIIGASFKKYRKYGPRSYLYKAWVIAMGRKPYKGESISPKALIGKIYKIKTRTVTMDEDGDPHPQEAQYSVAKILEKVCG